MDVQTAGTALVGAVPLFDGFAADRLPRHFLLVEFQCHGMGDDLESIIERTIVFAVDVLKTITMGGRQNSFGLISILSGTVHFQFYTEVPFSISIEYRFRFVVIVMDYLLT